MPSELDLWFWEDGAGAWHFDDACRGADHLHATDAPQRYIHVVDILTQNASLGITEALLRPKRAAVGCLTPSRNEQIPVTARLPLHRWWMTRNPEATERRRVPTHRAPQIFGGSGAFRASAATRS